MRQPWLIQSFSHKLDEVADDLEALLPRKRLVVADGEAELLLHHHEDVQVVDGVRAKVLVQTCVVRHLRLLHSELANNNPRHLPSNLLLVHIRSVRGPHRQVWQRTDAEFFVGFSVACSIHGRGFVYGLMNWRASADEGMNTSRRASTQTMMSA